MTARTMHLLAYLKTGPTADQPGGWRHPASRLDDILRPERYEHIARVLEDACFDGCFFADLFGLYDVHGGSVDAYVRRGGQISFLDPMMVLPLMGRVTRHLGLGATLSTTFHNPYNLARMLASLDHLTNGRVAWNVVTSATDLEARNFGIDELPARDLRYDRADEVLEACMKLWYGWEPDAFVLDKERGYFADPDKVHYANYEGRYLKTRGPLSIPRSPQGHPVIMQAGSSDRGRAFAARWAEMIFTVQRGIPDMQAFYADMKARVIEAGRPAEHCAILPMLSVTLGETESIANERAAYLRSLVDPELTLAFASSNLGADLTKLKDEASLAELQRNQGIKGSLDLVQQTMKAENLKLQEAAGKTWRDRMWIGTPEMIADRMEEAFKADACDGFIVIPTYHPGMHEEFCRMVVPLLQKRGLMRTRYAGATLRENLQA